MKITKQDILVWLEYSNKNGFASIDWYKSDKRHREDGPSTIWSDGDEYYYLNNCQYSKDKYWKKVHENY